MAFAPDGSLVTTRFGGPTLLWSPSLTPVRHYVPGGQGIAVSPDGSIAALIENRDPRLEGNVSFLDLGSGDLRTGSGGHHGPFKAQYEAVGVTFAPDGRSVVTVGNDSRLLIWDVATASVRTTLEETGDLPLRGPVLSADGTTAYTTDRNRDVVVWDLSGSHRLDRPFTAGTGFPGWPWFAMSADGRLLAVASASKSGVGDGIRLVDTSDLHVIRRIPQNLHQSSTPLAFSPDATTLAVGSWNDRSHVRLWDVASGRMTASLQAMPANQRLVAMEFNPDGSMLMGGTGPEDAHRGLVYGWGSGKTGSARGADPDSRYRRGADVHAGWLAARDLDGLGRRRLLRGLGRSNSPDRENRAGGRGGRVVGRRLGRRPDTDDRRRNRHRAPLGLPTGTPLDAPLTGLMGSADTVDLSPDGSIAVGADTAGNVLLWDVPARSTIGDAFPGPAVGRPAAASFTPDGRSVVVISDTGAGWVWDVDPSDWLARACQVAGRSLTPQEWQEFLPDRLYHATCGS